MSFLSALAAKAKALALNVSELELKVLEATNEDPWGPAGNDMAEIARAAEDSLNYDLIMNTISERLTQRDQNWRLCYKALLVLDYLAKQGPIRVVDELARSISSLERLRDNFEYIDPSGRDQGVNVRHRAGELVALVMSPDRLRQEREKALKNAGKYRGVSSSDMRAYQGGGGSGGFGGGGFGSNSGGFSSGSSSGGFSSSGTGPALQSSYKPGATPNFGASNGVSSSGKVSLSAVSGASMVKGADLNSEEDPFEATRRRIEKLKAEGGLPDSNGSYSGSVLSAGSSAAAGLSPMPVQEAPAPEKRGPRKLSEVKVNPNLAATFTSLAANIAPSGGAAAVAAPAVKLAPPPKTAAAAAAPPADDSFTDFFATSPVAAPAAPVLSLFDNFSERAKGEEHDDWSAFSSATAATEPPKPAVAAPPRPAVDFGDFFGPASAPPPAVAPAAAATFGFPLSASPAVPSSSGSAKPPGLPLSLEDFCTPATGTSPAPLAGAGVSSGLTGPSASGIVGEKKPDPNLFSDLGFEKFGFVPSSQAPSLKAASRDAAALLDDEFGTFAAAPFPAAAAPALDFFSAAVAPPPNNSAASDPFVLAFQTPSLPVVAVPAAAAASKAPSGFEWDAFTSAPAAATPRVCMPSLDPPPSAAGSVALNGRALAPSNKPKDPFASLI